MAIKIYREVGQEAVGPLVSWGLYDHLHDAKTVGAGEQVDLERVVPLAEGAVEDDDDGVSRMALPRGGEAFVLDGDGVDQRALPGTTRDIVGRSVVSVEHDVAEDGERRVGGVVRFVAWTLAVGRWRGRGRECGVARGRGEEMVKGEKRNSILFPFGGGAEGAAAAGTQGMRGRREGGRVGEQWPGAGAAGELTSIPPSSSESWSRAVAWPTC